MERQSLKPEEVLKKYFGYDSFQARQKDVVGSILNEGRIFDRATLK